MPEVNVARDEILALFKTAWDGTGWPARYDDVAQDLPSSSQAWARATVRHADGGQATLAGETGGRRFRATGVVTVQVFAPFADGLDLSDSLGRIVRDAFEGKATASGVWFRNVRIVEVGQDGDWFQTNVLADFEYDRVK